MEAKLHTRLPFLLDILYHKTYTDVKHYLVATHRNTGDTRGTHRVHGRGRDCEELVSRRTDSGMVGVRGEGPRQRLERNEDLGETVSSNRELSANSINNDELCQGARNGKDLIDSMTSNADIRYKFEFSVGKANTIQMVNRSEVRHFQNTLDQYEVRDSLNRFNDRGQLNSVGGMRGQLENAWRYNTTKCVDTAALIAVGHHRYAFSVDRGSPVEL